MLVVFSYPTAVIDEASAINALFDEGLEILHLRKTRASVDEIKVLIEKIKPQYSYKIALHQHHELAVNFGINRLHFTEAKRNEMGEEALTALCEENNLSTSIHQVEFYESLSFSFNYTFFGPVFNSISKQGYTSSLKDDFLFPVKKNLPKVIAIGGVNATNIHRVKQMQFDGAATLGTIWQKPGEIIQQFKALQKAWEQAGR